MASRDSLAVDFFLLVHDPFDDGRLIVNPEILGCGLVGGKLADLILDRQLRIDGDRVVAVDHPAPADEIDSYVVEAVRSQRSAHSVRAWVDPLQDDLYDFVGDRLVASGIVRREQGARRIGRGRQPDRFPSTDLLAASAPQQRLDQMMRSPKDLTLASGMLVALLSVLGIDRAIAPDVDRTKVREIADEIADHLPTDLRGVYDAVKAISGEASLRLR
jgi:hypothetical protein